jgi:hypothetical protein
VGDGLTIDRLSFLLDARDLYQQKKNRVLIWVMKDPQTIGYSQK